MNRTFFTGCPHYGHYNIIGLCKRPFKDLKEMEETLMINHNSVVDKDDTVYMLGDIAYKCSAWHVSDILHKLNGKLRIVIGNHDKPLRQAYLNGSLDDMLSDGRLAIAGGNAFLDSSLAISVMVDVNGQKVFLSHYSHRTWPNAFRNAIHLFSHSHGNLNPLFKSFDVGVDANSFHLVPFEDVLSRTSVSSPFKEDKTDKTDENE